MIKLWLILGFIGWIMLMIYRIVTNGIPKKNQVSATSYVRGFLFSMLLGPLTFGFLIYFILGGKI